MRSRLVGRNPKVDDLRVRTPSLVTRSLHSNLQYPHLTMCDDEVQVCQPIADACGGVWRVASVRPRERAHIRRVACEKIFFFFFVSIF